MEHFCMLQCYITVSPVQSLYPHFWISFPEPCYYYSMVYLFRTVCTFFFFFFIYKINSRRVLYFGELSATVEGGLEGKDWRHCSDWSPLENCNMAVVFTLSHLSFIQGFSVSLALFLPFYFRHHLHVLMYFFLFTSFSSFFVTLSLTLCVSPDYYNRYSIRWCVISPLSLAWEETSKCSAERAHKCKCFSAVVKHYQRHKMSASLLSITAIVNYTHRSGNVNDSPGKTRHWERPKSWKTETTPPTQSNLWTCALVRSHTPGEFVHMTPVEMPCC